MEKKNVVMISLIGVVLVAILGVIGYWSINNEGSKVLSDEEIKGKLVNNILDTIETYAQNGYILKDIMGDVTADKLTLEEAKNNRETYKKIIEENIYDDELFEEKYFEDNKLVYKSYFEALLNKLEIGTHMGAGTNMNEEGIQIFIVE